LEARVIRLFVADDLGAGRPILLSPDQSHYLTRVMRLGVGGEVLLFNGRDGEWRARLAEVDRREVRLRIEEATRPQGAGPDLDLIVALVKRSRLETIIEKAAELGARRVRLALTDRTNADRANIARLAAIASEAAEQTGRLDVPEILAPRKLAAILDDWPGSRRLMFCDEAGEAAPALRTLKETRDGAWAILIGPEGGFSTPERDRIRAHPGAVPVSLGPRILRADTAAISAMTLWQAALGDWRGP
jgi:16S rRNA (uracil1498-N3)-methyltransferase